MDEMDFDNTYLIDDIMEGNSDWKMDFDFDPEELLNDIDGVRIPTDSLEELNHEDTSVLLSNDNPTLKPSECPVSCIPGADTQNSEISALDGLTFSTQNNILDVLQTVGIVPGPSGTKTSRRKQILNARQEILRQPTSKSTQMKTPNKPKKSYLYNQDPKTAETPEKARRISKAQQIHQHHEGKKEKIQQLEQENSVLKQENGEFRQENSVLKQENGEVRQENSLLKQENGEVRQENVRLAQEIETLKNTILRKANSGM